MKQWHKGAKLLNPLSAATCMVLVNASHAFANSTPGPLATPSMFALIILLTVLTFAGGGYVVFGRLDEAKYPSKGKRWTMNTLEIIAGVVLFIIGIETAIFSIVVLSIYTIGRGFQMLKWAREAEKEGTRPAHLEGANPKKLKIAGTVLIILTLLVCGNSMMNIEDVIDLGPYMKRGRATELNNAATTAYSVAKAYLKAHPKGMVTCEDIKNGGYTLSPKLTCFSDMTATSGSIRITGPEKWKLIKPVAVVNYDGQLAPAEWRVMHEFEVPNSQQDLSVK